MALRIRHPNVIPNRVLRAIATNSCGATATVRAIARIAVANTGKFQGDVAGVAVLSNAETIRRTPRISISSDASAAALQHSSEFYRTHKCRGAVADNCQMVMAGLWALWKDPKSGDEISSCTILANSFGNVIGIAEAFNRKFGTASR